MAKEKSKPKAAATGTKRTVSTNAESKAPAKPKLNALQLATILKPFWVEVLSNNVRNAKKILVEFGHKLDFNAARYTPNADGTGLHLCAQYGFVAMAQMLLDFGLDMNVPNKVGSTPLHVACKFQQAAMVTFLLDKGAYVDLPDHQYRVAFDVAPYAVLDQCVLKPLRDKQIELEEYQIQLQSENQGAQEQFEAAVLRFMQQSMLISDFESLTWDERDRVSTTRVIEDQWEQNVQAAKHELEQKQALCVAHQQVLVDLDDERAAAALGIRKQAELEQRNAIQRLDDAQLALQHTTDELNHAQETLGMEFGLIDAATECPNDPDVQSWVLDAVSLMLEEREMNASDTESELHRLLMRTEIIQVVLNVFARFGSIRHLQVQAIKCLVQLLSLCVSDERDRGSECGLRTRAFATKLVHSNMITVVGDAMLRFENDTAVTSIALEALYRLFRIPNSTRQVMQVCQRKANQMLPLNVLSLNGTPRSTQCHAAFILFTMAKYNVRQGLLQYGIVHLIMQFLRPSKTVSAETMQYLVASLALLHSVPNQGPIRGKTHDSTLDTEPAWANFQVQMLLETVQALPQPDDNGKCNPIGPEMDALVYWTLSLLRNLVWHRGLQAQRIRSEIRSIDTLNWIGAATASLRTTVTKRQKVQEMYSKSGSSSSLGNIIQITLELIQATFVEVYDDDGRLMKTPPEVLEVLIDLLALDAAALSNSLDSTIVNELAGLLALLAKGISNTENQTRLLSKQKDVDAVVQRILSWSLDLRETEVCDELSLVVLLSSILRIYCCFAKADDYAQRKVQRQLHMRVKSIGLCIVLHAFSGEQDDERDESAVMSLNKSCVPILNMLRGSSASLSAHGILTLRNLSAELRNLVRCNCLPTAF